MKEGGGGAVSACVQGGAPYVATTSERIKRKEKKREEGEKKKSKPRAGTYGDAGLQPAELGFGLQQLLANGRHVAMQCRALVSQRLRPLLLALGCRLEAGWTQAAGVGHGRTR